MRDEKRSEELRHTARKLTQKKRATEANKRERSTHSRNWTNAELDAVTKAIAQRLKDVDKGGQNDG